MKTKLLAVLALVLSIGCTPDAMRGAIHQFNMDDGVRCYVYYQNAISCVVMPR